MSEFKLKSRVLSEGKTLYMLCEGPSIYCELGVWSLTNERNVLFGLRNFSAKASDFFKFVIEVTNKFDNLYAVPNKHGAQVWSVLKWKSSSLKVCIADKKSFSEKFKLRIFIGKFLFLNVFFVLKPSPRKSLILDRKIFYKGNLPKIILVDTF